MKRMLSSSFTSTQSSAPRRALLILAVLLLSQPGVPSPALAESVDNCVTLKNKLSLCYTYQKSAKKKPEFLVVTLPMRTRERSSFARIVESIEARYTSVAFVNFDLRGHGESALMGADTISYTTMSRAEYAQIPHDVREALRLIRDGYKELRKLPVIVIGASIGANSAAILANIEQRVKAAVILSPGMDYHGLIPGPHVKVTDGKRLLYMVGKDDVYSFVSADSLYHMTAGEKSIYIYNTRYHGTNIPNNSHDALDDLLEWIGATLEGLR